MENAPETTITMGDVLSEMSALMAKWMSEGNVDSEFDTARSIVRQVAIGELTPKEGIELLRGIDASRIER